MLFYCGSLQGICGHENNATVRPLCSVLRPCDYQNLAVSTSACEMTRPLMQKVNVGKQPAT